MQWWLLACSVLLGVMVCGVTCGGWCKLVSLDWLFPKGSESIKVAIRAPSSDCPAPGGVPACRLHLLVQALESSFPGEQCAVRIHGFTKGPGSHHVCSRGDRAGNASHSCCWLISGVCSCFSSRCGGEALIRWCFNCRSDRLTIPSVSVAHR